ncbi:HEAT repeat domain-containing protein [Limisphaera sp. 4302-co]|uniref:HEAT repeat domain-containing protein n=1 Tax=Limisphaera sp. 4302-co TaxID=3400417 RepID=UPI003C232E54
MHLRFATLLGTLLGALLTAGCLSRPVPAPRTHNEPNPREAELCARILSADTDVTTKADACRELARIGTPRCLPALAPLLTNAGLSHMALYALEPMPGPEVDELLRASLAHAQGRVLAGLLTTLGVRRDPAAVPQIATRLTHADAAVRRAAALALGEIATADAVQALWNAWDGASSDQRQVLGEALLRAADRLRAAGRDRDALRIYDGLRASGLAPDPIRTAALQGAILGRGPRDLRLLRETLQAGDLTGFHAALQAAYRESHPAVTRVLAGEVALLPPERQTLLLSALAERHDPSALPAILQATNHPDPAVQMAAVRALGRLGDSRAADALAAWVLHPDPDLREAARASLAFLPGKRVEHAIFGLLDDEDPNLKLAGMDVVRRRHLAAALPRLQRLVRTQPSEVRVAALRLIGGLGNRMQWNWLLSELRRLEQPQELEAARQALLDLTGKIGAGPTETEAVLSALVNTGPVQAPVLYSLLARLGGDKALRQTLNTARSGPPELRTTALKALLEWRRPEVVEALLALVDTSPDAATRESALRRFLEWAADPELTAEQRLVMCRQAARYVQDPATARLYLAAVGGLSTPEVVTMIKPFLEPEPTREEACAALITVAERLHKQRPDQALPEPMQLALQRAVSLTRNEELKRRAQSVLPSGN